MAEATTLGTWLRRERERRGVSLTDISEQTKLSVPLLQGLEADDLSRWPGGIFRRAFARSYATAIGVDPDVVVRRIEEAHPSNDASPSVPLNAPSQGGPAARPAAGAQASAVVGNGPRGIAAVLDLLVAGAIGLGFAAGGSRLLWPVLAIAAYHALGVLMVGRSPMLALLADQRDQPEARPIKAPVAQARPAAAAVQVAEAVDEDVPAAAIRAASAARTPTGRFRQPGRRGRGARAQGARG
jgi:transcriptional regulator with XRE-family HTH domain